MYVEKVIENLHKTDLPTPDLEFLCDVIGIESVRKLMVHCPGMSFYVPSKLGSRFHKKYIIENYNQADGKTARDIAKDLGITMKTVWSLLGQKADLPIRSN